MVQKIVVTVGARKSKDFLIIARTDAAASEGIDGAIKRAKAYVEAGADVIFPEALVTKENFVTFAEAIDVPLLANMTEFGKTPYMTADEFEEMGYKMVIFPITAMSVTLKAVEDTFLELMEKGTQKDMLDRMKTRDERYELLNYAAYQERDKDIARKAKGGG